MSCDELRSVDYVCYLCSHRENETSGGCAQVSNFGNSSYQS